MDRTYLAVMRQLKAMNFHRFEIGIRNQITGKMQIKTKTFVEVFKLLPYLKAQNQKNNDIYIRPDRKQSNIGLILIDDLSLTSLERMKALKINPALTIETSPKNYQAWIRLSYDEIDSELATAISKVLARGFNGDMNSADYRHFGRLAGFTNRKPVYCENGSFPYVLCHDSGGKICEIAKEIIYKGIWYLIDKEQIKKGMKSSSKTNRSPLNPEQFFLQSIIKMKDINSDISKLDFAICCRMIRKGFNDDDIFNAMVKCSPSLEQRKAGHKDDYVKRTINNAKKTCNSQDI